ncbi:cache domain-containing protein, partial [Cribrihabitans sp. XS_ASV171]
MSSERKSNDKPTLAWPRSGPITWRVRLALGVFLLVAIATIWVSNNFLTHRFTESTRNRAELRLALYSGNLISELQRNSIVPQLLARDPTLIAALQSNDFTLSTQRLISFVEEIGAASLMLLDRDGRVVAATDRNRLGEQHRSEAYFVEPLRSNSTVFSVIPREAGGYSFTYARRLEQGAEVLGVIVVEVGLQRFERAWAGISDAVMVTDSTGTIVLATEPRWRGLNEAEALRRQPPQGAIQRAIRATADWTALPADAYLQG